MDEAAWSRRRARFDERGKLTLLAGDDPTWVMVRRPRAMPFVMSRRDWDALDSVVAPRNNSDETYTPNPWTVEYKDGTTDERP